MHAIFTIWHMYMYLQYNEFVRYILLKYSILVLQNQKSTRSSAVHVTKKKNRFCWLRTNWYHTCTCIIHLGQTVNRLSIKAYLKTIISVVNLKQDVILSARSPPRARHT